jgi:penicillin-binding protein 1A
MANKKKRGKKRTTRPVRRRRSLLVRLALWLTTAGLVAVVLATLGVTAAFIYYGADPELPRISSIRDYRPRSVTRVLDRRDVVIGVISAQRRTVVPLNEIPKVLVQAVVAAEDASFFEHRGLDYLGMLRAFVANLRAGGFVQGGSTITQQVVKTFFLSPERTIRRKVQEVLLAQRLENELSKEEILYLYLNQIYFGHGRYGVQEASRFYFGKSVKDINLAESAMLAGLPQGPERLSPLKHPERAKRRQAYVLRQMVKLGRISAQTAARIVDDPIRVVRHRSKYLNAAPEVTDMVRRYLIERFGAKAVARLGARVHTTVDAKLQLAARDALRRGLRAIDGREGYRKALRRLKGRKLRQTTRRLRKRQRKFRVRQSYLAVVRDVDDAKQQLVVDLGSKRATVDVAAERYNPQNHAPSKRFSPGDLLRLRYVGKQQFVFDPGPQAALVAINPRNGDLLAMVGGYTFHAGDFNRATRAKRHPGSAFKPFVYGAALASGRYTPATLVDDAPVVLRVGSANWEPNNFDGSFRGPIRLRTALAHSVNTVAARLIDDVGTEPVRQLARGLGIESKLHDHPSLALGTSEVTPAELALAYAGLANEGRSVEMRYVSAIDEAGLPATAGQQVLRPEVAYVLVSMMQSVVQEGTGRRALQLRRPLRGRRARPTTTRTPWFVGFTPQLATAVWVGFDQPRRLGRSETGGRAALPIWVEFMKAALAAKPKLPFRQPASVTVRAIDVETGLLAPPGAVDALEEVFVAGTEPTERAPGPDLADPETILMNPTIPVP